MSLLLNVPSEDKALAAAKGAQWDSATQTWYLPEDQYDRLMEIEQWIPVCQPAIILPSEITIVQAHRPCWNCQHNSQVIALAGNYFFEKDINERDEAVWLEQDFFTLFQQVIAVSSNLQEFLASYYPHFKLAWSHTTEKNCWLNHCTTCDHVQGDWFLFDESGSIFNPADKEAASQLLIRNFQLAHAPLIDGVYCLGDHLRLISEFAERGSIHS
ncbi:DUF5710 domain-containing protein [Chitinophaga sp. 30R24]|uniref:DUF5710 domain-containing protein n=1 Tax=Chitinophaga sp. 30R24 TaxID=3248838 RepID=UPI003B92000E